MGIEDIFNGSMDAEPEVLEQPVNEQPPVEPVATPEPEAVEPQPEPEQQQEVPQQQEESRHVPLATFLDQRDEAKRWKQEAEQLRQQMQQRQQQPQQTPDPLDDPDGFRQSILQEVDQHKVQVRFEVSDRIARQQHGDEAVEAAGAWAAEKAKGDQSFALAYMQQNHPIDWIIQQHKRDQLMQQIGNDPDEYVRRRYAELNPAPIAAPVAAPQQVAQPAPPRSLASVPGSGGAAAVPTGPTAALDSVFSR